MLLRDLEDLEDYFNPNFMQDGYIANMKYENA
jgi:hypothetical protein